MTVSDGTDMMTEIRETHFSIDLPGDWSESLSDEPGTRVWLAADGKQALFVTMLTVRPVYDRADERLLIDQYLDHRTKWERGQIPELEQSAYEIAEGPQGLEGSWSGHDAATGRRVRHRVLRELSLLGDFCFETFAQEEPAFENAASAILPTAAISPP